MRPYLQDLVTRMADKSRERDSSKSVSWVAHRETERLNDRTMVAELSTHLQAEQVKQRRLACLFIIGKLGRICRTTTAQRSSLPPFRRSETSMCFQQRLTWFGTSPNRHR